MKDMVAEALVARIRTDMRNARKDGDKLKTAALQSLLAEISSAEAVAPTSAAPSSSAYIAGTSRGVGSSEAPRKELTSMDIFAVLYAELADLEQTLQQIDADTEYAMTLRQKISVINAYL